VPSFPTTGGRACVSAGWESGADEVVLDTAAPGARTLKASIRAMGIDALLARTKLGEASLTIVIAPSFRSHGSTGRAGHSSFGPPPSQVPGSTVVLVAVCIGDCANETVFHLAIAVNSSIESATHRTVRI